MQLVQRPFIYVYNSGSVAGSQRLIDQSVQIEADSGFALRGLGGWAPLNSGNKFSLRFADAGRRFLQSDYAAIANGEITPSVLSRPDDLGFGGNYTPQIPQVVYPPNSVIQLNLRNDDTVARQITLLFFGVGLYRKGSVWAPGWQNRRFTIQPFSFVVPCQITRGATATIASDFVVPSTSDVNSDSDFVFTHAQLEVDTSQGIGAFTDLRMLFKDNQGKQYSSDFVPVDMLLGHELAERPSMIYPGIYLPKNEWLWFDLQLNDTGAPATLFLQIAFEGYKVFPL